MLGKQLHTTRGELKPDCFIGVQNRDDACFIKKPAGGTGLWTSSWRDETKDSAWVEWCYDNDFGEQYKKNWYLLTPLENVKLFVVDSMADFHHLLGNYGYEDAKMRSYRIYRTCIDFERMAQDYHGIWLTEKGNEETHLSYSDDLNSWDCESVLWFKWCFVEVQRIKTPQAIEIN
jgi:hypothetical protein